MPALLRDAGYRTSVAGKWHLGTDPAHGPGPAGFERSWVNLHGGGSHFSGTGFFEGGSEYTADGEPVEWPEGAYSTEHFTDRLIEFIGDGADDRPFFAFAAYTSPHWPLQVPDDYLDRYAGMFDQGYDRLREQRMESLRAAGIAPQGWALPPRNDAITPWVDLSAEEQRREARAMELYAAMVENLDHHVGRLVEHLEAQGLRGNTLIVFVADNGAAAEDFYNRGRYVEYLRGHYDDSYENMGRPGSWVSYGPQWAEAGSAPYSRYKGFTREGGIIAPALVTGPGVAARGDTADAYVTVMDIAPTLLELAGATYPERDGIEPMRGESLVPFLAGRSDRVHDDDYVTALFHWGVAFLRRGSWKLTSIRIPFSEDAFGLFDLSTDPGETRDLSDAEPELREEMIELWRTERRARGIVLPQDL